MKPLSIIASVGGYFKEQTFKHLVVLCRNPAAARGLLGSFFSESVGVSPSEAISADRFAGAQTLLAQPSSACPSRDQF
jgi:hypothetical protein